MKKIVLWLLAIMHIAQAMETPPENKTLKKRRTSLKLTTQSLKGFTRMVAKPREFIENDIEQHITLDDEDAYRTAWIELWGTRLLQNNQLPLLFNVPVSRDFIHNIPLVHLLLYEACYQTPHGKALLLTDKEKEIFHGMPPALQKTLQPKVSIPTTVGAFRNGVLSYVESVVNGLLPDDDSDEE
jgi:hypothetical protein